MNRLPVTRRTPNRLGSLIPLARTLVEMLGRRCEVVIHNVADPQSMESTIFAVEGNVTGRSAGGPPTDYLLQRIRSSEKSGDCLVYPGKTADGRPLRSSTTLIRDPSGTIIGAFCINLDMSDFLMMKVFVDDLCQLPTSDDAGQPVETFARDAEQTYDSILQSAIRAVGKPLCYMSRQERARLVRHVEEGGGFLMRGAAERLAKSLGVTRSTIYNYLAEARRENGSPRKPDSQ